GVRARDRRLRSARASLFGGRGSALRLAQPRRRFRGADRRAPRRSGAACDHGRLQPAAVPRAHGVGAQRRRTDPRLRAAMRNDRRVRLVLAGSGTTFGGTERVLWEVATRLPPARFDVRVWLRTAPGVDE